MTRQDNTEYNFNAINDTIDSVDLEYINQVDENDTPFDYLAPGVDF